MEQRRTLETPNARCLEVTAQMASVRKRGRTLERQHPSRTDPIMHPARKNEVELSDALIVKSYAMSAPKTGFVIPLGGGSAAADESKTR